MNQNMSAEDALALNVVASRKAYMQAHNERLDASKFLADAEREESRALNFFNENKKKFDEAMDKIV